MLNSLQFTLFIGPCIAAFLAVLVAFGIKIRRDLLVKSASAGHYSFYCFGYLAISAILTFSAWQFTDFLLIAVPVFLIVSVATFANVMAAALRMKEFRR